MVFDMLKRRRKSRSFFAQFISLLYIYHQKWWSIDHFVKWYIYVEKNGRQETTSSIGGMAAVATAH